MGSEMCIRDRFQKPVFRAGLGAGVVPFWTAHGTEQYGVGLRRQVTNHGQQGWGVIVYGDSADVAVLHPKIMAEYPAHGLKSLGSLIGDFRPDTVTCQYGDLKIHRGPPRMFYRKLGKPAPSWGTNSVSLETLGSAQDRLV